MGEPQQEAAPEASPSAAAPEMVPQEARRSSRVSFVDNDAAEVRKSLPRQAAGSTSPRRASRTSTSGDIASELLQLRKENVKLKEKVDKAGRLGSQVERLVGDFEAQEADAATRLTQARGSFKEEQEAMNRQNESILGELLAAQEQARKEAAGREAAEQQVAALRQEMARVSTNGVFGELKEELMKQKQSAIENVEELLYVTEQKEAEINSMKTATLLQESAAKAEFEELVNRLEMEKKAFSEKSTEVSALKAEVRTKTDEQAEGNARLKDVERKLVTQAHDFEQCRQALLEAQKTHAEDVESLKHSLQDLAEAAEANNVEAEKSASLAAMLERAARKEQQFLESKHELTLEKEEALDKISELSEANDKGKKEIHILREQLQITESRLSQVEALQKTSLDGRSILKIMDIKGLATLPIRDNPDAQPEPAFFLDSPLADVPAKAIQSVEALASAYLDLECEAERLSSLVVAQGAEVHNQALADFDRRLSSLLHKAEELDQVDATGVEAVKDLVASARQASNLRRFTVEAKGVEMLRMSGNYQVSKAAYDAAAPGGAAGAATQPKDGTTETAEERKDPVVQSWRWGRLSAVALHLDLKRTRRAAVRKSRVPLHWAKIMSMVMAAVAEAFHKRNLKAVLVLMLDIFSKHKVERDPLRRGAMNPNTSRYEWLWMLFACLFDHRVTAKARGAAIVMGPAKKHLISLSNDLFLRKWMRFTSWLWQKMEFSTAQELWSAAYKPKKAQLAELQAIWSEAQIELQELQDEAAKLLPASCVQRWCHLASRLRFLSQERARLESVIFRKRRLENAPTLCAPAPPGGHPHEIRAHIVVMRWMRVVSLMEHLHKFEASYRAGKRVRMYEQRVAAGWRRFTHVLLHGGLLGTINYSIAKAAVQRKKLTSEVLERETYLSLMCHPAHMAWARMALSFSRLHLDSDSRCNIIDGVRVMRARAEGYRNSAIVAGRRARLHAMHAMTAHQVMHDDLQHRLRSTSRSKSPAPRMEEALQEKTRAQLERSRALFAQEDAAQNTSPKVRTCVGKAVNGKAINGAYITRAPLRPSSTSPSPTPTLLKSQGNKIPKAD